MQAVQIRLKVEKMKKRGEKVREYFVAALERELAEARLARMGERARRPK
jgi:hypothetical protein